jgi:hypothetical protein
MQKTSGWRVVLSGLVVVAAGGLLGVSVWRDAGKRVREEVAPVMELKAVNVINAESLKPTPRTSRKTALLPNHPLYLMERVTDRARLMLTQDPNRRVTLLLTYADERMRTAEKAIEAGEYVMALETMTKSSVYLYTAEELLVNLPQTGEVRLQWEALLASAKASEGQANAFRKALPEILGSSMERVCQMFSLLAERAESKLS